MPIKVFISYKHQDPERNRWVENLYQDLRSTGIDAKLDNYEVAPGKSFSDYMTRGIRECDSLLFIITPKSVEAVESGIGALAFEAQIANARRMSARGNFTIIPILREGLATSTYLSDHRYLDFRDDGDYDYSLQTLIKWLYGQIKPPPLGTEKTYMDQEKIPRILANTGVSLISEGIFRDTPVWDTGAWLANTELLFGLGKVILAKGKSFLSNRYVLPLGVPAYAFLYTIVSNLEDLGTKILPFFRSSIITGAEVRFLPNIPLEKPLLFFDLVIVTGTTAQVAIIEATHLGITKSDLIVLLDNDLAHGKQSKRRTLGVINYLPIYKASHLINLVDIPEVKAMLKRRRPHNIGST